MVRSNLTTKFHIGVVAKYEKSFKEQYKKENEKPFKGNVIQYITIGVVQNKRTPELSDCLTLIKLGNINCDDEQAEAIATRWLEDENNKQRGISGMFCDLCKDICIDLPLNKQFIDYVNKLEDNISNTQDIQSQLLSLLSNMKISSEKENKSTEDNKESNIVELNKEKQDGIDKEDTQ